MIQMKKDKKPSCSNYFQYVTINNFRHFKI